MRTVPLLWLSSLCFAVSSACVYDPDARCGPHQTEISNDRCTCEPGYVFGTTGCAPCPDNEEERSGQCVCSDGYARPAADAACEAVPDELGISCEPDGDDCPERYPVCHETPEKGAYCTTSGCSSSADCEAGYMCEEDAEGSYCRRPPLGYGKSCASQDDCAEGEATFCELLQTRQCIVACTAETTDVCFEGEVCCDFSLFNAGTVCTPAKDCVAPGTPLGAR
jgi:hypothetical protein